MADLVLRSTKGSKLTSAEGDFNLSELERRIGLGDNNSTIPEQIAAAGDNLVLNGNLELGDNTNFPGWTYSAGAVTKTITAAGGNHGEHYFSVDTTRDLYLVYKVSAADANHEIHPGVAFYDENYSSEFNDWVGEILPGDASTATIIRYIKAADIPAGAKYARWAMHAGLGGVTLPSAITIESISIVQPVAYENHPAQIEHEADADAHGAAIKQALQKMTSGVTRKYDESQEYTKSTLVIAADPSHADRSLWRKIDSPYASGWHRGHLDKLAVVSLGYMYKVALGYLDDPAYSVDYSSTSLEFVLAPYDATSEQINTAIAALPAEQRQVITPLDYGVTPKGAWDVIGQQYKTICLNPPGPSTHLRLFVRFRNGRHDSNTPSGQDITTFGGTGAFRVETVTAYENIDFSEVV